VSLAWENLAYLVASVLFIVGIKGLTHPRTARRGNMISAAGMLIAIVATLMAQQFNMFVVIAGLVVGAAGVVLALRVKMTQMPEMVALLNGFGGAASVLVAWVAIIASARAWRGAVRAARDTADLSLSPEMIQLASAAALSGLIGGVTFWGSLVAFGKLHEMRIFKQDIRLPAHQLINAALLLGALIAGALVVVNPAWSGLFYVLLIVLASMLGLTLVVRIGGADMPVVIALLNSYSGLAAAATGFVIENNVLLIAGSLVGASGIILTIIMCRAMNRSLANVLFGGIDAAAATASADDVYGGKVKSAGADEVAMLLDGARRVVIVPGYGMAVAQAQSAVRDLYNELESRGTEVEFAIHPVAGRMPGHMNVLLAEVDIPYEKLREMDDVNPTFKQTDVAIVLGANDVVNPDARENPQSPIAGMPILNVDQARTVVVIKRSLSPGFAGIPNPLFAKDNTLMYFADGKDAVMGLLSALKDL
jgi:H+-translocating NAD(P) transhydrogenase subunit beta